MEASSSDPTPPPPATTPAAPAGDPGKAGMIWRILALVLALVLAFLAAVIISVNLDVSDKGVCGDNTLGDCYDFSKGAKPFVLFFGWAAAAVAIATALWSLVFTVRGRGGRQVLMGTGLAVVLYAISVVIAQVS
jgi:hypothetical protein